MVKLKLVLLLFILVPSYSVQANLIIKSIRYEGNEETQESVMSREIYIGQGDLVDEDLIEASRQAIMDLGLFKSVSSSVKYSSARAAAGEKYDFIDVVFKVVEKRYLLVLPKLKVNNDERFYGVQFQWDNVKGLNHKMRLLLENRGQTQSIKETRKRFSYIYPHVQNSNFNMKLELQEINKIDEFEGLVNRQDEVFKFAMSRWLNKSGRSRGWIVSASMLYQQRFNEVISGDAISDNINAVVLGLDVEYKNVKTYEYNRGGKAYGYNLNFADDRFASDTEFTKQQLYYRSYYRFKNSDSSNLNVQTKIGYSNNTILGEYAFSLGGSSDLRGYDKNRFKGNALFVTNIELMLPQPNYPVLRYVYFVDFGNTYDSLTDITSSPMNFGVGAGVRIKIRAFVKLDLRADVGYGISEGGYQFSFGSRHVF